MLFNLDVSGMLVTFLVPLDLPDLRYYMLSNIYVLGYIVNSKSLEFLHQPLLILEIIGNQYI